jgi:zinc protease
LSIDNYLYLWIIEKTACFSNFLLTKNHRMKMKYLGVLVLGAAALVSCKTNTKTEGYTLLEEVTKKGDEITIPYQKFKLDNGLTVVVHEDKSDPVVYTDVTYHVGSAREEIGRSGFAHFFEHMMFQGSDHVADEEHFKTVSEAGGTLNGTTNSDRTNYFETVPSNQLEIAMWLEADRMGWLLDAVTQEKFEIQRSTVKNERGQNYDNRPYGMVGEVTSQALYPHGHPYSWPTIGYLSELDEATVKDLKDFFLRWYGPNNATLTIAGDVTTEDVMKLAVKYFGPIQKGPEVVNMEAEEIMLAEDKYVSHEDKIRFPLLQLTFPTVPNRHTDEAPLDVLSDILGGGKNSIFYQTFDKPQKALQSSVGHPCAELGGRMTFTTVCFPGTNLKDMETEVRAAMATFEERGVTQEDIDKFKSTYEASTIRNLSSVQGKGSTLASYQTFENNPNYIAKDLERYRNVTIEDVKRVYEKYIKDKHCVVLSYVPEGGSDLIAAADNFSPTIGITPESVLNNYDSLVYNKPAVDTIFDRSVKPKAGPSPFVQVPEYWTASMENGIRAIGTMNDELPLVTVQISVPAGHRNETLENAGISGLLTQLMSESTENHTAEEISEKLENLGSRISVSGGGENITVSISSLTKNLDKTLELAKEIMFKPAFKEEEFARVQKQTLEGIANTVNQASQLASNAFAELLYGEKSIKAIPQSGTEATVSALTVEDVKAYYQKYFSAAVAKMVVVGNLPEKEILGKLAFLNEWKGEQYVWAELPQLASAKPATIYFMDKEGAAQSEIRIGYKTDMPYDPTGDYYKAQIMNFQLGGNFNSRINVNLREDKGYTYGARSGFRSTSEPGLFGASAGVRKDATAASVKEFMFEMNNYVEGGITEEELAFTKSSMTLKEAREYETPRQKAGFLRRILDYNLDGNFVKKQSEILGNMSKEDILALAKKHVKTDEMIITIVGDKAAVWDDLVALGYPIVDITKQKDVAILK